MTIKRLALALLLVAAIAAAGFFALGRSGTTALEGVTVIRGPAIEAVYATAVVEPVHWAAISPLRTGRITEVRVNEGLRVGYDVVLAQMDNAELLAQEAEQESLVRYALSETKRAAVLVGQGHMSEDEYEQKSESLKQAQARLHVIQEQLGQLTIKAPVDGTILWRDVEVGEVRDAGKPIFWIGDPKPLRLEAEVDEEDIPRVRPGQDVLITADAWPGKVMKGRVASITPKGDPVNKSYRVYVGLPDDTPLMIGMTVETNTITNFHDNVLLVPTEAVTKDSAVWVGAARLNDTTFRIRKVPVKTGIRGLQKTEILAGLKEGQAVIVSPPESLKNDQTVKIPVQNQILDSAEIAMHKPPREPAPVRANGSASKCPGNAVPAPLQSESKSSDAWQLQKTRSCSPSR